MRGHRSSVDGDLWLAIAVAIGLRVVFVVVTERVWEDALITVQHARNAAAGLGLTHHLGEGPTHGFTSALSVLLPLAGEVVHAGAGLATIRVASLVATVLTLIFAGRLATELGLSRTARLLVLMFLAIEFNHVFYGMAGMETQIAVAVLMGALLAAIRGSVVGAGIGIGLALLARPDFVLLVPFLGLGLWLAAGPVAALRSGIIGSAIVAPWVLFTWLLYGSPIPQTVVAKAAAYASLPDIGGLPDWVADQLVRHVEPLLRVAMPFFADTLVASAPVPAALPVLVGATLTVCVGLGVVATRRERRWWPILGFLAVAVAYRVLLQPSTYYDWYAPPLTAAAVLVAARALDRAVPNVRARTVAAWVLVAAFLLPWPWILAMERHVQQVAEDGVRTEVAHYLARHVESGASVASESAGYVGLSGVLLWDYPGLTSPTALAAVQRIPRPLRSVAGLVAESGPDWAVLRPSELDVFRRIWPVEASVYAVCADIGPGGAGFAVGGLVKRSHDLRFLIISRHPCPIGPG